jgi:hypothetical protein
MFPCSVESPVKDDPEEHGSKDSGTITTTTIRTTDVSDARTHGTAEATLTSTGAGDSTKQQDTIAPADATTTDSSGVDATSTDSKQDSAGVEMGTSTGEPDNKPGSQARQGAANGSTSDSTTVVASTTTASTDAGSSSTSTSSTTVNPTTSTATSEETTPPQPQAVSLTFQLPPDAPLGLGAPRNGGRGVLSMPWPVSCARFRKLIRKTTRLGPGQEVIVRWVVEHTTVGSE